MSALPSFDSYPLASLQTAMLVNHLRAPQGSGVDVVQMVGTLRERVDVARMRAAWARVTERHDALRTAFRWEGLVDARQEVHASVPPRVAATDWTGLNAVELETRMRAFLDEDRRAGFDLRIPPLQRVTLIEAGPGEWRMVWTFHHILMDGRSFSLVLRDVFAEYDAAGRGERASLPEPSPRYRDFVSWFAAREHAGAEPFWRQRLAGLRYPTPLPAGFPEPDRAGGQAGRGMRERRLAAGPTAALYELAREHGLTMSTIVQGAWALLLSHHSGESDVTFGATRACRKGTIDGAETIVGMFINTLPVRARIEPEMPLLAWLAELRRQWRATFAVEHTPLRLVHQWSEISTSAPLFETQIVYEHLPLGRMLQADGEAMSGRDFDWYGGTNFPLTVVLFGGPELTLRTDHARASVDDATASRLLDQLAALLEQMAAHPAARVGALSPLPARERELVVEEWNRTARAYPDGETLVSLIGEQVARTPGALAVRDERTSLTYAELDACAAALARRLRAAGVGRDVLVGVCAERSVELMVALVAVVMAGGAYVPLDPEYPSERLAFMLEDAAAPVLLAQRAVAATLPQHGATVLWLDDAASPSARVREREPATVSELAPPAADDLAYMIYTSGSTGRPKGALNTHRGIVNRLRWMQDEYALGASDVVLQKTPFSFDVSVWEFFWPLIAGASVVMARPGGHRETGYLVDAITTHAVSVCHFVPSMLRVFLADAGAARCTTLRDVMASGEALAPDLVATFGHVLPASRLHNLYGPTECAVDVTYWPCPAGATPPAVVPIGRPVANTRMYVLDARGCPTPVGVAGELHIGGVQVGGGYHRRPELTAEKFVPDPFDARPGARLYRTGDLARWRPDGTLEYLGRLDFQVKLRGFRIELGEIEAALLAHPRVRDAVVVARGEGNEHRLVAFLVAEGEALSTGALRAHLLAGLPEHMVPAMFVWLPALPLSSNGKVDRRALPAADLQRAATATAYVAPRTDTERALADIWARALRVDHVGVEDNFFELGGDSLLCVQIVARAALVGVRVTLTQVLRQATVAALARVAQTSPALVQQDHDEVSGAVPLTPVQHWFFEQQRDEVHHWNQAFTFRVPADLNADAFAGALAAVAAQHDSLRLRFERTPEGWRQWCVAESASPALRVVDLADHDEGTRCEAIAEASATLQGSFDLAAGPLIGAALFRGASRRNATVVLAVHHLAIDGVSWRVLLEDLETAYGRIVRGEPASLPACGTPFSRWATRLAAPAVRHAVRDELAYWESVGSPASLRLPRDLPAQGDEPAATTDTLIARLDERETRALLQAVPAAYSTQINDALLAALADALGDWAGAGELVVNVEGHGREDVVEGADLSRTMGWFTTIFPVRLRLGAMPVDARLRETKELLRAVPGRGLGYGVLRYLGGGAETLRAQTTPDVVFNYMGQFDQVTAGSALFGASPESTGSWYGPRTRRPHLLEVNGYVVDGRLELRWSFGTRAHRRETIARVAERYLAALRAIVAHCTAPGAGGYTPSDFPLARLEQASLDALASGRRDLEDVYPLVPMQRLFLGYADSATDPGFEQWRFRLRGALDTRALRAAWDLVTSRHAILRTAFVIDGLPEPMQVVRRSAVLPWAEHDLRGWSGAARETRVRSLLDADRAAGFALDRAPLMRVMLLRLADDEYELVWSNHHLLLDRWSWPLVLGEISRAYPAFAAGVEPSLEPPAPYRDFVAWQQARPVDEARAFWARHFAGFEPAPRSVPRGGHAVAGHAEDAPEVRVDLTAAETGALHRFARRQRVGSSALIEAAWALWLARRAGHHDVSFGVAMAGRDAGVPNIERVVGLTINNLPLRVRVDAATPLSDWLAGLHDAQAELQQFAHVPLERVQEWSGVPWRTRLFETLLVFQDDDAEASTRAWLGEGLTTEMVHVPTRTAYPLSVIVTGDEALSLRMTYDPRYFDAASATGMAEGLRAALLAMVGAPEATLGELLAKLPEGARGAAEGAEDARLHVEPRTATEAVLASIWEDVLGVERVGVEDNFFALGGYSLVATQIVSRVRATLQLEAPVRLLFQHPTVSSLASALAARERKPGQLDRIAQVVRRVHAMSADDLRRAGSARAATT